MAEEPSKIKDLLAAVNASSGVNKLGIKVDYAAGSMLEGSLNELKHSAKLQVEYLSQLVGFQEQSLKDARLKSVQGDSTEKLQDKKGIGSDLANAGKAGLDAAFAAGGPFGALVGLMINGLIGATLAYKAVKPSNARENAELTTEKKVKETRAQAEERARAKAEADAKRAKLEEIRESQAAELEDARARSRAARAAAEGPRVSERGDPLRGNAKKLQQARYDRELDVADRLESEKLRNLSSTDMALDATKGAGAVGDVVATEKGAGALGLAKGAKGLLNLADKVALPLQALITLLDVTSEENKDRNKLGATVKSLAGSFTGLLDLLAYVPGVNKIPGVGGATEALNSGYDYVANSAIGTAYGDVMNEVGEKTGLTSVYHGTVVPLGTGVRALGSAYMNHLEAGDMSRTNPYGPENPSMLVAKMIKDYTTDPETGALLSPQQLEMKREMSRLSAPQSSSTPPIVVVPPQSRPDGGGSNIVNSHNTQNTTVIQKNDASTSLAMGWTMLGYGFGSIPMGQ